MEKKRKARGKGLKKKKKSFLAWTAIFCYWPVSQYWLFLVVCVL